MSDRSSSSSSGKPDTGRQTPQRWVVTHDRHGLMFSGPLDVGKCVEVVRASLLDDATRALEELHAELAGFAEYSRAVAADATGQSRLTWQERAEWAARLADVARLRQEAGE